MQSKWSTLPLEQVLDALIDYRGKSPPKSISGIPVISAKVVKEGRVLQPIDQTIDPAFYPVWMTRGLPQVGDVIMTTEGPLGEVAQLDQNTAKYALGQRVVCMRGKTNVLDNTFFNFLLRSPRQQAILRSFATGTTVEGISQKALRSIPIAMPKYDEQVVIGRVLGALDDKIALNRQMNETLEATIRAIFKDWFVDFGPTRAKIAARAPYMTEKYWAAFPDKLGDDDTPEGWRNGKLGDIAKQVGESVSPDTLDPDTPYIGLEHMPRRSISLISWEGAGKVTSGKLAFKRGDFLFGKLRPYFHKVGIAPLDGICSTDIVVLNARNLISAPFVLTCISQDEFVSFTDRTSDGTKMPRTSWDRMERFALSIPSQRAFEAFNDVVTPMLRPIVSNILESRTLAKSRDLLLPRIMSGELCVRNAIAIAEKGV